MGNLAIDYRREQGKLHDTLLCNLTANRIS